MSQVEIICLVVVVMVIAFYALAFFFSFHRSSTYQIKVIHAQDMDEEIGEFLVTDSYSYFLGTEKTPKNAEAPLTFAEYREMKKNAQSKGNFISNFFMAISYILIALCLAVGVYFRLNSQQAWIGDNSYIVIESGSMSAKNSTNTYLTDPKNSGYNMDNQILTFDLIQLEKISDPSTIHLYDVVAYWDSVDNITIVHRVIGINIVKGVYCFQFRGDANAISSSYETIGPTELLSTTNGSGIPFAVTNPTTGKTTQYIRGHYTGNHNLLIGLFVSYFRSDIGLICGISGILVLGLFYFYDASITKAMDARELYVAHRIDESADHRYKWYLFNYRLNKRYKKLTQEIFID